MCLYLIVCLIRTVYWLLKSSGIRPALHVVIAKIHLVTTASIWKTVSHIAKKTGTTCSQQNAFLVASLSKVSKTRQSNRYLMKNPLKPLSSWRSLGRSLKQQLPQHVFQVYGLSNKFGGTVLLREGRQAILQITCSLGQFHEFFPFFAHNKKK